MKKFDVEQIIFDKMVDIFSCMFLIWVMIVL